MTDANTVDSPTTGEEAIDSGSYELLRNRLFDQSATLGEKATALNARRVEIFGGTQMTVIGNERIRTENNCIPRDLVGVGDRLLFGYNVFIGLRKETRVADVFSQHRFPQGITEDHAFPLGRVDEAEAGFLSDPRFQEDFHNLYRYYKDTRLLQLRELPSRVLAIFQIGTSLNDVKVLRWSIDADGSPTYMDDRGARDHVFPESHDFSWKSTGRNDFVFGTHPHINILDEVFVETVGGDLTIKVENNTEDGWGIYREPVDDADQALDDGKVFYARVGKLILLKIQPFGETIWRYFVFNTRAQSVDRIDAIGRACLQLPEEHGVIFPGGYYLETGENKSFEGDVTGMRFARIVRSPNGEDVLYVFYEQAAGRSILLPYNVIRKEVPSPIGCHGYSLFDDGKLLIFRAESGEPTRVHPVQIWQTAFMSDEYAARASVEGEHVGSYLVRVGNADLVRGISDCHSVRRMVQNQKPSTRVYEDLITAAGRLLDIHFWLGHEEVGDIAATLQDIRSTAELIVDEFEKVKAIQQAADEALAKAESGLDELVGSIRPDLWNTVDPYIGMMDRLRGQRGHLITLKEMRYINTTRVDEMEQVVVEHFDRLTGDAVRFLQREDALRPYRDKYDEISVRIEDIEKTSDAKPLQETLDITSSNLDLLTEVVSTLQIEDPDDRIRILEEISEVFALINRAKATLETRRKELATREGVSEFGAQFKLFGQSVHSAVALADTPEKCDEQLTRLMVQIEELEGRFSEFDEFLADLVAKREEVYETFAGKKQRLLDERNRRADHLAQAADRILQGVSRRAQTFKELDGLNAYFAADPMVLKVRDLAASLHRLDDAMRAEDVVAKLKATRDDAARMLRDRTALYEEGENVVRLGRHRFAVNTQELALTLLPRGESMVLHLTGTGFFEATDEPELDRARAMWDQTLVSETSEVYRSEYLAASVFFDAEAQRKELSLALLHQAQQEDRLLDVVRNYAAQRYDEGYDRGVHDHDATLILEKLLSLYATAGLLRFGSRPRALAGLFWCFSEEREQKDAWLRTARNLGRLRSAFTKSQALGDFAKELGDAVQGFSEMHEIPCRACDARLAGEYLAEELARVRDVFTTSAEAVELRDALLLHLDERAGRAAFEDDLHALEGDLATRFSLVHAWLDALIEGTDKEGIRALKPVVWETVALLLAGQHLEREVSSAQNAISVKGLLGQHARIRDRTLPLRLDEFLERLGTHVEERVPAFQAFRALRARIVERERSRLRLDELKPRVLSSFVRNRLIDEVYLPLIGDNLAKQVGAYGDTKRTDLMGMLLLISPPGYGKTTLMEYMASCLGLVFMKINGPALGHAVTSLDPAEAPNATARQELERLNLALEMGNNVMLYVDDIQHTSSELLQKFISLCDAQRRVEGVWGGRTKTYDLRGKRFCVCMAGNPYTESGEKFQIPDMLANRADVYNLGDVLTGKERAFALSYVENALTSSPVLAPLANRDLDDVYALVRMAQGEDIPASELKHDYAKVEIEEFISILRKLFEIRDVLLKVNRAYIASASQDDRFRSEPRFQLQGSYRNMNKLTEKVVAAMNAEELDALLDDHYVGEAQTLTSGAEANLLKLKEMRDRLPPEEAARWEEIKKGVTRLRSLGGPDEDPVTRVTKQLSSLSGQLDGVRESISSASLDASKRSTVTHDVLLPAIQELAWSIHAAVAAGQSAPSKKRGKQASQIARARGALDKALAVAQSSLEEESGRVPAVDIIAHVRQALEALEDVR
ncbi:DNA repair ATPase [Myxococcota bacterium]